VKGQPEHEQGEHGVKGGEPGRVVARADEQDLHRHQREQPEAHADRGPGPRADQREQEQQDRGGVERPAEALVGVEALRPEDPEAGQEHLHDDADRDQQGEPVVCGRDAAAHCRGTLPVLSC
jgi:hypothetical protein